MVGVIIPQRPQSLPRQTIKHLSTAGRGAAGERGLILGIISQAVIDYLVGNERESEHAAAYFMGPVYQNHLQWLGLPGDYLPELINGRKPDKTRHF